MSATGAGTRRDVTLKLPQLQNLCKRDPASYRDDYDRQIRRLRSECSILALSPSAKPSENLVELARAMEGLAGEIGAQEIGMVIPLDALGQAVVGRIVGREVGIRVGGLVGAADVGLDVGGTVGDVVE